MRYQPIVAAALSAVAVRAADTPEDVTGELGDAVPSEDNPVGVTYVAKLPEEAFTAIDVGGNIKGSVVATAGSDGNGVEFKIKFSNLPMEGGPLSYHLHAAPVPEDGNCTLTKAHLDPYKRGPDPPCDSSQPETCEVGDLSGKYGKIEATDSFEETIIDLYASTKEGDKSFFGDKSIVIHYANSSRITCANFQLKEGDGGEDDGKPDDDCECEDEDDASPPPPPPGNDTVTPPPADDGGEAPPVEAGAAASAVSFIAAFAALMFAL